MGLTEASLGGGGQLLSKYKLCALNPVKVTNYFCDKGSKNCWWVALQEVPGTSQRWAKGWSWNGIQPLLCDNQILPSLAVLPAPSFLPLLPTLWTDILRLEGVDETRQSSGKRKEDRSSNPNKLHLLNMHQNWFILNFSLWVTDAVWRWVLVFPLPDLLLSCS